VTRRKATVEPQVEPAECLLCGGATPTFADPDVEDGLASFELCGPCNRAFAGLARDLARAAQARESRLQVVAQVPGQLALDDEPAHDSGTYRATPAESLQVLGALRYGETFEGVSSFALLNVKHDDEDHGYSLLNDRERNVLQAELARRA
jgi:hypothetical protein